MMSDLTEKETNLRYSISSSDGSLPSKAKLNNSSYHQLAGTRSNYLDIISWCKKLNLLKIQFINDIEAKKKMTFHAKFKLLLNAIESNPNNISPQYLKIFENVVKNLQLIDDPKLNEYTEPLTLYEHLEKLNIKKWKRSNLNNHTSKVPVYPIVSDTNRGVLFFVNMINFPLMNPSIRNGAEYDKNYLIELFRAYRFRIYYYEDLLMDTFCKLVERLVDQYLEDTELLVFVVASHGDEWNNIQFYYDQTLTSDSIINNFNNVNCKAMADKPKILLFPFCRGAKTDRGVYLETDGFSSIRPIISDVLICYATVHGFTGMRDDNYGSWYIEAFCKMLSENGHQYDIERILHLVAVEISEMCKKCNKVKTKKNEQLIFLTPSFVSRDFNKLLFFNPGYEEEAVV